MFGWLFGKKPHVWRPKELLLYGYFDGQKDVLRDPMPLYRKLVAVWPELEVDTQLAASELAQTKDQLSAQAEVAVKARAIFDLKSHEDGGLPEREATLLLWDFWNWVGGVKKIRSRQRPQPRQRRQLPDLPRQKTHLRRVFRILGQPRPGLRPSRLPRLLRRLRRLRHDTARRLLVRSPDRQ